MRYTKTSAGYERTYNLRNYQSVKLSTFLSAEIEEGDDPLEAQHEVIMLGTVELGNQMLKPHQIETLAKRDGFQSVDDFFAFFSGQSSFVGQLIWWEKLYLIDETIPTAQSLPLWEFWEYAELWEWLHQNPGHSSLTDLLRLCDRQTQENDDRIWAIAKAKGIQAQVANLIDLIPF